MKRLREKVCENEPALFEAMNLRSLPQTTSMSHRKDCWSTGGVLGSAVDWVSVLGSSELWKLRPEHQSKPWFLHTLLSSGTVEHCH